ncbi:MAG: DUF2088 domain-containing protein [Deltaproteobacteria bacterium]|nr:DUF2088 domain-containing protein [Deltaproteobacteria bacterium]
MKPFRIRSQKGDVEFDLPPGIEGVLVEPRGLPEPIRDPEAEAEEEVKGCLGWLQNRLEGAERVAVCVTDVTRDCHEAEFLKVLTRTLLRLKFGPDRVSIVVAQGLHRNMTDEEKAARFGANITSIYRVHDHDAYQGVVSLGTVAGGFSIQVNKVLAKCDAVLSTGLVELHQYAGYSGGTKTVGIGCAGAATIAYTHSPKLILDPRVLVGKVEDNPFRRCVDEVASRAKNIFALNEIRGPDGKTYGVAAGDPAEVLRRLVAFARTRFSARCGRTFDAAVVGVPFPKGANLYQASRAATYVALSGSGVLNPGAPIIIHAPCGEGAGLGTGELAFYRLLASASSAADLLEKSKTPEWRGGEQRALIIAHALARHPIIVAGTENTALVEECKMTPAADVGAAIRIAQKKYGAIRSVVVVPDPFTMLPTV